MHQTIRKRRISMPDTHTFSQWATILGNGEALGRFRDSRGGSSSGSGLVQERKGGIKLRIITKLDFLGFSFSLSYFFPYFP